MTTVAEISGAVKRLPKRELARIKTLQPTSRARKKAKSTRRSSAARG